MIDARKLVCASLSCFAAFCLAPSASAFERQWHLGGGLGAATFAEDYGTGPAASLYAAYGISDMFDVRLELTGSRHAWGEDKLAWGYSGAAGLAYKVDVLSWVPYFGLLAGYQGFSGDTAADSGWAELSIPLGLDYSPSRSFAIGAQIRSSALIRNAVTVSGHFLLRAEYRWGY